jgi:hypothetical protein
MPVSISFSQWSHQRRASWSQSIRGPDGPRAAGALALSVFFGADYADCAVCLARA